jgi:hypothetical protein
MWIVVLIQTVGSIVVEFMRRRKTDVKSEIEIMKAEIKKMRSELGRRK